VKFQRGNAGKPRGARNKAKAEVKALLRKLERAGDFDAGMVFTRLQRIALGDDPKAAVAASKVLLEYRFGRPVSALELEVQHELGPSVVELLEEIGRSAEHRRAIEDRERRQLAAVTVKAEGAPETRVYDPHQP
jgi:hypothetical protein